MTAYRNPLRGSSPRFGLARFAGLFFGDAE